MLPSASWSRVVAVKFDLKLAFEFDVYSADRLAFDQCLSSDLAKSIGLSLSQVCFFD